MARTLPYLVLWGFVGALFGVGLIAILSIGWPLILLGLVLAGAIAWIGRGRGFWAALIGFGIAPAAILIFDIVTAPPPCPAQPVVVTGGSFTCGYIPPAYGYMAAAFLAVALAGALIPLVSRLLRARRDGGAAGAA